MILVMPDGDTSCFVNSAEKPEDRYEDYLVHDLIADVEARFPAATGRESRAFAGVSMGGYAAVKLALSRPELFVFAGAISPAVNVTERPFRLLRAAQWWKLRSVFGPWGSQARRDDDPFLLVQSATPAATPYIYLTAGEQEILFEPIGRFAALLKERAFSYEFHTKPGGHDRDQWQSQLPDCFESLLVHLKPAH
jgi:S-formylglutathione hydrolase FrmB